jgi:hypothetical protein
MTPCARRSWSSCVGLADRSSRASTTPYKEIIGGQV